MEKVLFHGSLIQIGSFELNQDNSSFSEPGYVQHPIFVFPKNSIWIRHEGKEAFVADTSLINFYNQGQTYYRSSIHPDGDYCHWFAPSYELIDSISNGIRRPGSLFPYQNSPCSAPLFLQHLKILSQLRENPMADQLMTEELAVELFKTVMQQPDEPSIGLSKTAKYHRLLVENTKQAILENLGNNLSLTQLARKVNSSPYHLSRIFKYYCRIGMSEYRNQQRILAVALRIQCGHNNLTELALNFGFSSHSHLSACFRRHFSYSPTRFREITQFKVM